MVSPSAARGRSRSRSRSRGARPRWAAPTFRPAAAAVRAAPTPCMAKPTVQQELEEIEISSHFMQILEDVGRIVGYFVF